MGIYLNSGNEKLFKSVHSKVYVDKTGLLQFTNKMLNTDQQYLCISRLRRFGKSMAANMLTAYYSRGCDSKELFAGLETFEALRMYIDMNFEGLKDDVLTLLIHLGYLGYDFDNKHNDENALRYTISLALYAARNFYHIHREFPGGKGFVDLVFLPRRKFPDKLALVVELKWNQTAEGALAQIKRKEYCSSLSEYHGNLLLVGINYDKGTRKHTCRIEEFVK